MAERPMNAGAFRRAFNRAADREVARRARLDGLRAMVGAFQNYQDNGNGILQEDIGGDNNANGDANDGNDDVNNGANGDANDGNDDANNGANGDEINEDGDENFDDDEEDDDDDNDDDEEEERVEDEENNFLNSSDSDGNGDSDNDSDDSDDSIEEAENVRFNDDNERERYVYQGLRDWAREGGAMSMRKLDKLLAMLHPVFPSLPLSYKTLLETPQNLEIHDVQDGVVWSKGIRSNLDPLDLEEYLTHYNCITLDLNFDGLPLFNHSLKKFWPALGRLVHSKNAPFIISIFYGECDPSSNVLLERLVEELLYLQQNGFQYRGVAYEFKIRHFICDAPARAKVKGIIEFNGRCGCEKCEVEGEWIDDRMTFCNLNARLRTDETFVNREQEDHHKFASLLEETNVGLVSQFRLDAMHLVHLGAYKRLLTVYRGWNGPWKLALGQVAAMEENLINNIRPTCPYDFNRKPKHFISKLHLMKATELRRSLLYEGVVVLKQELHPNVYKHFLLIHCGISILSSPIYYREKNEMANELLRLFIQHGVNLFGEKFVVYNIHCLCHLAAECAEHHNLDSFSAFIFENKLKSIKSCLNSGFKPLQQAAARDLERPVVNVVLEENEENQIVVAKPHFFEHEIMNGNQYKFIQINGIRFRQNRSDSCFQTVTGDVAILHNIVRNNGNIFFIGYKFQIIQDLYEYPIPSSEIDIVSVSQLGEERIAFPLADIRAKCWLMPNNDNEEFACFPLLHSVPLMH